jgi:nicotinamidase-related amidase
VKTLLVLDIQGKDLNNEKAQEVVKNIYSLKKGNIFKRAFVTSYFEKSIVEKPSFVRSIFQHSDEIILRNKQADIGSCFLERELVANECNSIYVCGFYSNGSLVEAVKNLIAKACFKVVVLKDLCFASENKKRNLEVLEELKEIVGSNNMILSNSI